MDMSKAYFRAVTDNLPAATIVFDHFHVIKLFNDKLQEFRRQLFNKAQSKMEKKVIKGTRWLLLKNPEDEPSLKANLTTHPTNILCQFLCGTLIERGFESKNWN